MIAPTDYEDDEAAGSGLVAALPQILWQRRWLIVVPAVLALAAGIAAALLIPPLYRSTATVLIESEQLSGDAAAAVSGDDAIDQRIARARERVLTRKDMIALIRANDLYPEQQRRQPLSRIVDAMRDASTISAMPIELGDGVRPNGQGTNTIALRISFDYPDPAKAQLVAQQYVDRFLEVDAGDQQQRAANAAGMLADQQGQLAAQIAAIEAQVSRIKVANGSVLAVQGQLNGVPLADASQIDSQIASLQGDAARAAAQSGGDPAVAQADAQLRSLQARLSPTHPDVMAAKAQLDAAREAAKAGGINPMAAANRAQIAALRQARAMLMADNASARAAAARAPAIADQVDQLEKKADLLREQYRAVAARAQGAEMNKRIEIEQRGERLTLADPPIVPDRPFRPDRPAIIGGALAAGLAFGIGLALLLELLFRPIRGSDALRRATGEAPIAIIPDLDRRPGLVVRLLERHGRRRAGTAA